MLEYLKDANYEVAAVGKIEDIIIKRVLQVRFILRAIWMV